MTLISSANRHVYPGRGMYPGYEQYWRAILANPEGVALHGKVASKAEIAYARFADKTPHIVLSKTLDKVAWKTTRIVRNVEEIRHMKQQPGKDMHAGRRRHPGSSLMNLGLIDELPARRASHCPRPRKGAIQRRKGAARVEARRAEPLEGKVGLTYST